MPNKTAEKKETAKEEVVAVEPVVETEPVRFPVDPQTVAEAVKLQDFGTAAEPVVPQVKVADLLVLLDRQRLARAEAVNQLRVAKDAMNIAQARLGDEGEAQGEIDALLASLL